MLRSILFWTLACALLLAPGAALAQHGPDYCAHSPRATLILFDRTTPPDEGDVAAIRASVGALVDGLQGGERVVLVTIESHYSLSRELFQGCMPACPPSNGPFGECSALRAQRDARAFRGALFNAIHPMLGAGPPQRNSDITGTIARQARRGARPFSRVVLFSDMLENSQALPWRTFRDTDNAQLLQIAQRYQLIPSLRGASIAIAGFGRAHDPDRHALTAELDNKVRAFWSLYFQAAGAHEPSYE